MATIELNNVSKRFDGTPAVQDTSFTIEDGELFILVGPSGCGKSTLLNLIVGLETLSTGAIRLNGQRIDHLDPKDRNMAMVFQSYALYPHMSVRENMAFPLKLAKRPHAEITERVDQAARLLELESLLDRKPAALSGGQRQRVAMGRAIVREPQVFLLDEPLSNLDAKLRVQMRTEIARLQRRLGITTLYVTHDQTEAMTLGDRIAVMHAGEVLQIGTPRAIYERPRTLFVAGFIGSPAMNLLPARYSQGQLQLPIGSLPLTPAQRAPLENSSGPLIAGFRPQHLVCLNVDAADSLDSPEALSFELEAEVVEWLGADLIVYFRIANLGHAAPQLPVELKLETGDATSHMIAARIDPSIAIREGEAVRLALPAERVQVFSAETGTNLTLSTTNSS
ncbi:MAG: sn-glycerol-3-phosphate ABC transporter ATP-binding protein UgpC [Gammaproteobacteria bacterium]|jgi:multiple sugar transport system ATP-binding protein|nr:sn-glycerol-3-phosphate ABC transporter ATP-binding protein UgpC [Gammaproteobacteria bacterium]